MPIAEFNNPNLESQAKKRRGQRLVDQHGRPWFAVIELKTGDPVGQIEPQFQAPLVPPQVYLRKSRDENRPNDLVIQYEAWIDENLTRREELNARAREISRKMFGTAYDPTKSFAPDVLEALGEYPEPVEPIIAAYQGNSYVLGLTTVVDERVAQFFLAKEKPTRAKLLDRYDFRDEPGTLDPEALEEELDPHATGGTRVPRRKRSAETV